MQNIAEETQFSPNNADSGFSSNVTFESAH